MFHLIGVDHSLAQRKKRALALTEVQRRYEFVVESAIQSIHPDLLAEEDHPSYLAEDEAESILLPIAEHHNIPHIFVEADRATQVSLGYKNLDVLNGLLVARGISSAVVANAHKFAHQFPIRERYWLRQLSKIQASNILLIFGDHHLTTVIALLTADRIPYSIFAGRVGIASTDTVEYQGLQYAKDNNMFGQTDCFCLEDSSRL
jgi:hypothetical protein